MDYLPNYADNNELWGSLPTEIGKMTNLNYLSLRKSSES
jgi:hypothetical protein